jgi:hypothetical protein
VEACTIKKPLTSVQWPKWQASHAVMGVTLEQYMQKGGVQVLGAGLAISRTEGLKTLPPLSGCHR